MNPISYDSMKSYNAYTDWREAVNELRTRQSNPLIHEYVKKMLPMSLPAPIREGNCMVLCRNIATPNYETHRFLMAADALSHLRPVVLEFTKDKFVGLNKTKKALGRMCFVSGSGSTEYTISTCLSILDVQKNNGLKFTDIKTHSGDSFIELHHSLFFESFPYMKDNVFDLSDWVHDIGGSARIYYKRFLCSFLQHAILFENFFQDGHESAFTHTIVLPALEEIQRECGYKPLIVRLEPAEREGDAFWLTYPQNVYPLVHKLTIGK